MWENHKHFQDRYNAPATVPCTCRGGTREVVVVVVAVVVVVVVEVVVGVVVVVVVVVAVVVAAAAATARSSACAIAGTQARTSTSTSAGSRPQAHAHRMSRFAWLHDQNENRDGPETFKCGSLRCQIEAAEGPAKTKRAIESHALLQHFEPPLVDSLARTRHTILQ